jgi:hypothetical protein
LRFPSSDLVAFGFGYCHCVTLVDFAFGHRGCDRFGGTAGFVVDHGLFGDLADTAD